MKPIKHKLAVATAVAAAFSMSASPAWAGGHGHHGGHHGGHHDDDWDIDGDDVLAGVLILGGIAAISAIAGSGKHHQQASYPDQSYPEPASYPDNSSYQAPPPEQRYRSGGMAEAVDACVAEIENGRGLVGSVDRASRSGEGWYVAGDLDGGSPFACWVDSGGQVTNVRTGREGASYDAPADDAGPDPDTLAFVSKQQAAPDAAAPAEDGQHELARAEALAN